MTIKTVTLSADEQGIELDRPYIYVELNNLSTSNVLFSAYPEISEDKENVIKIAANNANTIGDVGFPKIKKVYAKGSGEIQVVGKDFPQSVFSFGSGGSASAGSTVEPSVENGHLTIDGTDHTIYDDTEIKELINNVEGSIPDVSNFVTEKNLSEAIEDVESTVTAISDKIGVASGIAQLNESGTVPQTQLPSYVDDVIEVENIGDIETGEAGKIYVDTTTNKQYRWAETKFIELFKSDLVQASSDNGCILINGQKTKVYDDSTLRTSISNLVPKSGLVLEENDVNTIIEEALRNAIE